MHGITIIYILDYNNPLYPPVWIDSGRAAYAEFARKCAEHFRGRKIIWEIWNEPNENIYWDPKSGAPAYCSLVQAASQAIMNADSSASIAAPAVGGVPIDWLREAFSYGLLKWINMVSVHPYTRDSPESFIDRVAALRSLINQYSSRLLPVISGEWGYSLVDSLSEIQQAEYLTRMFLVNSFLGVPISVWYDLRDDGNNPQNREYNYGMLNYSNQPKPAFLALKALDSLLDGYRCTGRQQVGNADDYVLRFAKGELVGYACWTTGADHEIKLPFDGSTINSAYDMVGRVEPFTVNGFLNLSGSPQYFFTSN